MAGNRKRKKKSGAGAGILTLLILVLAGTVFFRWYGVRIPFIPWPAETPAATQTPEPTPTPAPVQTPEPTPAATAEPAPEETPAPPEETPFTPPRGYTQKSYDLVNDMVYAYAYREEAGRETVSEDLEALRELDPALGGLWGKIMDLWKEVNADYEVPNGELPDGLAEDDSLCIVVLGFQLEHDGSMSRELESRCEVALAGAEKYPNALIAVTGGGTALYNHYATEAGVMADWLEQHGVDRSRILTEETSLTTADNAIYTCELLREQYPQVRQLAIVSSDYHVPLGVLVFQEKALLYEYETGKLPFAVAACAGCDTQGRVRPESIAEQKNYVWAVADPTY